MGFIGSSKLNQLPERITILRALQLGDLLCIVPALRALRTALPEVEITLIGLSWARSFVKRFSHYFDDLIEFPGFPGFPEQPPQIHKFPEFLQEIQWLKFDLAIQMHGSGVVSNSLIALFGATTNAGYYSPGYYRPNEEYFLPYPENVSEVKRHLQLMEFLGFPSQGEQLEFPLNVEDWEEFHDLVDQYHLENEQYACIHPGARSAARRWSAVRFAEIGNFLASRGITVVLTGSDEEAEIVRAVENGIHSPVVNLVGKTNLGSLAALLSHSRLLVSNDTGVSHIAAAREVPSVVIFTASEVNRWAPEDRFLHRIISNGRTTKTQTVLNEIDDLLQLERNYAQ